MRLDIPRLVQDRLYLLRTRHDPPDMLLATPLADTAVVDDGPFLDGPVSPRIAIVDIDAASGVLRPGSRFTPKRGRVDGVYALDAALLDADVDPLKLEDTHFIQQSVFATVYHTLQFFEQQLGRPVTWAFGRKQLLVVPRAGDMRNAFYERESGSIQFFAFTTAARPNAPPRSILTALSHDIVVHETTHAILDGIAPDLYDAILPESLALHEAIADLAAIFTTLLNEMVVWSVANITSAALDIYALLARIAEEFGHDVRLDGAADFLRSADTRYGFPGSDLGTGVIPVDYHSPHACGQVLTGAIFAVFRRHADSLSGDADKRILRAAREFSQLVFPALDLLPPGEADFADFAHSVAAQSVLSGRSAEIVRLLREELRLRGVDARDEMRLPAGLKPAADFGEAGLQQFADDNRQTLAVPPDARLTVTQVRRSRSAGARESPQQEVIVRLGWAAHEVHDAGRGLTGAWSVRTGVTVVLEAATGQPRAVIRSAGGERARVGRGQQLRHWMSEGLLMAGTDTGPGIPVRTTGGRLSVAASARSLHMVG